MPFQDWKVKILHSTRFFCLQPSPWRPLWNSFCHHWWEQLEQEHTCHGVSRSYYLPVLFVYIVCLHQKYRYLLFTFSSCAIVQLPQPSHPPHSPSTDDSTCTDACLWSDTGKARLLQRCAPWHSILNVQTLQHVQNSAAQIALQAPRRSHTKPLLRQLHWLPVQHRITYKLVVLTWYKVLSPDHIDTSISELSHQVTWQHADSMLGQWATTTQLFQTIRQHFMCQASAVLLRRPVPGTLCQEQLLTTTY